MFMTNEVKKPDFKKTKSRYNANQLLKRMQTKINERQCSSDSDEKNKEEPEPQLSYF